MPAAAFHMAIAKRMLKDYPNLDERLFIIGNICPDSWRNSKINLDAKTKHYKSHYMGNKEANYLNFWRKHRNEMDNSLVFGYFIHLMTDHYWYRNELATVPEKRNDFERYRVGIDLVTSKLCEVYELGEVPHLRSDYKFPIKDLDNLVDTDSTNKTVDYVNRTNHVDISNVKEFMVSMENIDKDLDKTYEFILQELSNLELRNNDEKKIW